MMEENCEWPLITGPQSRQFAGKSLSLRASGSRGRRHHPGVQKIKTDARERRVRRRIRMDHLNTRANPTKAFDLGLERHHRERWVTCPKRYNNHSGAIVGQVDIL